MQGAGLGLTLYHVWLVRDPLALAQPADLAFLVADSGEDCGFHAVVKQ